MGAAGDRLVKVEVVVNRAAGGGSAAETWDRLEPLARRLADIRVTAPADREASCVALGRAAASGAERLVVVGGDGTIHLAVNQLMAVPPTSRPTLGIVPAGTGSDLARALALPRRAEQALRRAFLGPVRFLDIGCCEAGAHRFFFANIASAGIGGLVDSMVNAIPDRGRTAFLRATLAALRVYRPVGLVVSVNEEIWYEGPVFLVAVANGTSFGKGMRVAPQARMDDGLFDIVLVRPVSGLQLLRRLPQVYLGRHLGARQVSVRRGGSVRITPTGEMPPYDVDGETYPATALELTVAPSALGFATSGGTLDA